MCWKTRIDSIACLKNKKIALHQETESHLDGFKSRSLQDFMKNVEKKICAEASFD